MKIERNETYNILGISKNELNWLNDIIEYAIESGKYNPKFVNAVRFRNEIVCMLNNGI